MMKTILSFLLIQYVISSKVSKQVQFQSEQFENNNIQESESDKLLNQLLKTDKNNNFNLIVDKIVSVQNTVQQQKEQLQNDLEVSQNQIQKIGQYQGYLKKQEQINDQLESILETIPKMNNDIIIKGLINKIGQLSDRNEKDEERNRFLEGRVTNLTQIMNMKDVQLQNMGNTMNQQNRLKHIEQQKQIEMQEQNDKQMMEQQQQIQDQQTKTQQNQDEIQRKQDMILQKIKLEKLGKFRRDRVNAIGIRLKKQNQQQSSNIDSSNKKVIQSVDIGQQNETKYPIQQLLEQDRKSINESKVPNEVDLQNTIERNNQILKSIQKEKQEISQFQNNNQQNNNVDSVQEAEVVQNLDDVNGVFEKKYNLKIENFTGNAGTIIQKQASQYHRNNDDFHNYHTVQYLPEGALSNKSRKIQLPQEQNQTQQDSSLDFDRLQSNQYQQLLNKMQQYDHQYQQNQLAVNDPGFINRILQAYTNNLQNSNSQQNMNDVQQNVNYQNNIQSSPSQNDQDNIQYSQQNLNYRMDGDMPIEQSYQYEQN